MEHRVAAGMTTVGEQLAAMEVKRSSHFTKDPGPPPPRQLPLQFHAGDEIGAGGEGTVFKATWTSRPGREVAVKVRTVKRRADGSLPPLAEFAREASLGALIRSQYVCQTLGVEVVPSRVCSTRLVQPLTRRGKPGRLTTRGPYPDTPWEYDAGPRAEWQVQSGVYRRRTAVTSVEAYRVLHALDLGIGAPSASRRQLRASTASLCRRFREQGASQAEAAWRALEHVRAPLAGDAWSALTAREFRVHRGESFRLPPATGDVTAAMTDAQRVMLLELGRDMARGVDAVHQVSHVHNDIKLDNFVYDEAPVAADQAYSDPNRATFTARIIDLNGATTSDGDDGHKAELPKLATRQYLAPELLLPPSADDAASRRTDSWSFHCVLLELLRAKVRMPGAEAAFGRCATPLITFCAPLCPQTWHVALDSAAVRPRGRICSTTRRAGKPVHIRSSVIVRGRALHQRGVRCAL